LLQPWASLRLQQYNADDFQFTALTALSRLGTAKSYVVFAEKAKAAGYAFERTNAVALALDFARLLYQNKDVKTATRLVEQIYKAASAPNAVGVKVAALGILVEMEPKKQRKNLLQLSTSENATLRTAAVGLLDKAAGPAAVQKWSSAMLKLPPAAQVSLLNVLKNKGYSTAVPAIEKSLPGLKDPASKVAAYQALAVLSKGENADFLIKQLPTAGTVEVKAIQELLVSASGSQTITAVNRALAGADEKTQLVLLEVLAKRSNTASAMQVFPLTQTGRMPVKAAAYHAWPMLVQDRDFEATIEALKTADVAFVGPLQQAAVNALLYNSARKDKVQHLADTILHTMAPTAARYFPIFAAEGSHVALHAVQHYVGLETPVRKDAIQALANWSNSNALSTLTELLRKEKEAEIFNLVFSGFVKQVNVSALTPEQKTLALRDAFSYAQTKEQKQAVLRGLKYAGTYQALVFAQHYLHNPDLKAAATDAVLTLIMDNKSFVGADVRRWLEEAKSNITGAERSYIAEAIVRHLAEMPHEAGYIALFNGQDLNGWKGLVENPIARAKMSPEELQRKQLEADRKIPDYGQ